MELSVIIPYHKCEESLVRLCDELKAELSCLNLEYEVIFIIDGPQDFSWDNIKRITQSYDFKSFQLTKNFGQHPAIKAGLSISKGSKVVIMDCDLQDPPELISKLLSKMVPGIDVVFSQRLGTYDNFKRRSARKLTGNILKLLYPKTFKIEISSFMLLRRKVVDQILTINNSDHVGLLVDWLNYPSDIVKYSRSARTEGMSSYSFRRLLTHGLEAMSFDLSHLFKILTGFSLIFSSFFGVMGLTALIKILINGSQPGWGSLFVAVSVGFSLCILLLALIGYVVTKSTIYSNKPKFIINYEGEK